MNESVNYFERVKRFADDETIHLPQRQTAYSAGYDFEVAEDVIIPPYDTLLNTMFDSAPYRNPITLGDVADITKKSGCRPTLVPTGVKAILHPHAYLQLSVRSSCPLKSWLILANGTGVVDSDYASPKNPNDGEIFFQLINLSPWPIKLVKGDKIGQGIILPYLITRDDNATGERHGGFGSTT